MRILSKTVYFLLFILILILIFWVMVSLKSQKNPALEKPIVQETVEKIDTNILPKIDEAVLKTLQKEDLPKGIENLKSVHLDVPVFKQEYIRSCEEASLRMVLAFYGIKTNDMEIVKKVGYNPHPWDTKNNIWDDPNTMFVGSIDDPKQSGYGAFAPAIASAGVAFGRDAKSYLGVAEQFIAQQIYYKHP